MLHGRVLGAGVVLGDPDQRAGQNQTNGAGAEQFASGQGSAIRQCDRRGKHRLGHKVKSNQRQDAGDSQAFVKRRHHIDHAGAGFDEEATDDGCHDGHAAEYQRVEHHVRASGTCQHRAQHHGGDQGHCIGFEQVSGHTCAVTDVVTDVVGDHRRVARVIFRNASFDFAHQVSADVSAFGENAAAQTREDGNQR